MRRGRSSRGLGAARSRVLLEADRRPRRTVGGVLAPCGSSLCNRSVVASEAWPPHSVAVFSTPSAGLAGVARWRWHLARFGLVRSRRSRKGARIHLGGCGGLVASAGDDLYR